MLGQFVTSTYYRDRVHPWVETFNRARPADAYFSRTWERLRPELDYAKYSGPDDQVGEGLGLARNRVFPHALDGDAKKPGPRSYAALYNSPFGNDVLFELAREALNAEQLGQRDVPDLLCLSFSCNDVVGHCFGPDSQEVLDCTLRTDKLVGDLLALLDEQVGKGQYAVVMSADHGICPLPEISRANGRPAARLDPRQLSLAADDYLAQTFLPNEAAPPRFVEVIVNNEGYLSRAVLRERKLDAARVEGTLARWLREQPGIQAAYGRAQLLADPPAGPMVRQLRESFHPDRSGDVLLVPRPYHFFSNRLIAVNHGTPHSYDTHVPLVVFGPGVKAGERRDAVTPLAAAPVLARFLGVPVAEGMRAKVPEGLFE